jgi:hypothetical protein
MHIYIIKINKYRIQIMLRSDDGVNSSIDWLFEKD